jgi:hypothetical protein
MQYLYKRAVFFRYKCGRTRRPMPVLYTIECCGLRFTSASAQTTERRYLAHLAACHA